MELIDKAKLYEEAARREELARNRVADTPGNSPAYARYVTQLNERTEFKQMIADAVPVETVKHGKWVKPVPGDGENRCSVCKAAQLWFAGYGYYESDFCPNCGAKMDGR